MPERKPILIAPTRMTIASIGKYHVLGTLGQGAHSTILHIRRSADAKPYALKVVPIEKKDDKKYLDQVKLEFRVGQLLDHPNLIKIYTLETESDWLFRIKKAFLLIEFVNGKTVDLIGKLQLSHLVQIFLKTADALVHCHRKGVCHADLKPNNIMLSKQGEVKIIDYGLAWIRGQPKGRIQGTPEYIAPETARSSLVNEKTDIYNLGATMYRLVTGKLPPTLLAEGLPIDAKTFSGLLRPVKLHNPRAPTALCDLIEHCLAFNPAARPARMSEVQGSLDVLAEQLVKSPKDKLEAVEW